MTADTPVHAVSTGKGLTATVVHVLAERGRLDYDLPLAAVWPEFARHGKDAITLRHVLTHTAGLPALPADVTPEDFTDWTRMCELLADARPLWAPGERLAYHAWTWGWLLGEVVRRVTGAPVSRVLADEVAGPLGVDRELFLAVPEADLARLARLEDAGLSALMTWAGANLPHFDAVAPPAVRPDTVIGSRPDVLRADVSVGRHDERPRGGPDVRGATRPGRRGTADLRRTDAGGVRPGGTRPGVGVRPGEHVRARVRGRGRRIVRHRR